MSTKAYVCDTTPGFNGCANEHSRCTLCPRWGEPSTAPLPPAPAPHAAALTRPGMYPWLVVIVREGTPTVTPFANEQDARDYFDVAAAQWSESFLCRVEIGPVA